MIRGCLNSNRILFILVCYKEKYWETASFLSLTYSHKVTADGMILNLYIADNTDVGNWNCDPNRVLPDDINIFYNKYNNPGLSYAYNRGADFAKKNGFSWIVLLDQDTVLPIDFYPTYNNAILNSDIPLKVPITFIDGNRILSPSKYIAYRSILLTEVRKGLHDLQRHSFINTGMLIKVDFYFNVGGYNEEIKLDFTDHDFVARCKKLTNTFEVVDVSLKQDFSSVTNKKEQAITRYHLYLKDLMVFSKNKKNRMLLFINADLLRLLRLTLKYKSLEFIKVRFRK